MRKWSWMRGRWWVDTEKQYNTIQLENSLARRHMKELEHEKVVLDERKMVGRYRETIQYNTTREQSRSATHEGAGA